MNCRSLLSSIFIFILLTISTIIAPILTIADSDKGYKVIIAIDQLWAVIIFGKEDITISSLLWYNYFYKGKKHYHKYVRVVDTLAYIIARQQTHCKTSYDNEVAEFKGYTKIYDKES